MNIIPKITCEIVDCKYLKIVDTTVYTIIDPASYYGRAFFVEMDDSTVKRVDFSNATATQSFIEYIKDGLHKIYMAVAPRYESGKTYGEGSIVSARLSASAPNDPPSDDGAGYLTTGVKFYRANKNTNDSLHIASEDWDLVDSVFASLALFQADPKCKVATTEEIVNCRSFNVLRTDCRKFRIEKNTDADYIADIYSLKSYLQDERIYSFAPAWVENKAIFDFNQIAPEDISNIYIIKLMDAVQKEERDFIIVYDLCKALKCQNRLIMELLCVECESCIPSRKEAYKRYSLNRMIALFGTLMLDIHQSEFLNIGASTISDTRYTAIKNASEKLDLYLKLIFRCGDCEEEFKGCEGC